MQYRAHILEDTNHSIASFNERRDASIPESFGPVALFIDGSEVGMTYHDNAITFEFEYAGQIDGGKYKITDFYVTSGQDPDHHIKKEKVVDLELTGGDSAKLTFVLGRKGSTDTANWWKNRVSPDETINEYDPHKLNFAFIGDLTMEIDKKRYVFSDFALTQSYSFPSNYWMWGGKNCHWSDTNLGVICNAKDEDGKTVPFKLTDNSGLISHDHIGVYRWESSPQQAEEIE